MSERYFPGKVVEKDAANITSDGRQVLHVSAQVNSSSRRLVGFVHYKCPLGVEQFTTVTFDHIADRNSVNAPPGYLVDKRDSGLISGINSRVCADCPFGGKAGKSRCSSYDPYIRLEK